MLRTGREKFVTSLKLFAVLESLTARTAERSATSAQLPTALGVKTIAHGDHKIAEAVQVILKADVCATRRIVLAKLAQHHDPAVAGHPDLHVVTLDHLERLRVLRYTRRHGYLRWNPGSWEEHQENYCTGTAPLK